MRPMRTWIVDPETMENVENLVNLPDLKSNNLLMYIGDNGSSKSSSMMTLEFLAKYSIIPNKRKCSSCDSSMTLVKDSADKHFGLVWHCAFCKTMKRKTNKVRVRDDSFFENMKLTIEKVLFLAANWVANPGRRIIDVAKEHGINKEVVGSLHHWFRDLTQQWWERAVQQEAEEKLGGPGRTVEINESLMYKTKYIKGSLRSQNWVIGMIENETKKVAMVEVNERNIATLLVVVEDHIQPETMIVSDGWAAYGGIENLRAQSRFNFVEPNNTSTWGAFKKEVKSFGDPSDSDGHMCNYMFRKAHDSRKLLNYLMIEMKSYRRDMSAPRAGEGVEHGRNIEEEMNNVEEKSMVKVEMENDFEENRDDHNSHEGTSTSICPVMMPTISEVKQEVDDAYPENPDQFDIFEQKPIINVKTEHYDFAENNNEASYPEHATMSTRKRVCISPPSISGTKETQKIIKTELED